MRGGRKMAYDRYDTRDAPRGERSRWSDDRDEDRGRRDERGFFERAGDEIASWFGDDDADRRPNPNQMRGQREGGGGRDHDRERERSWGGRGRDEDFGARDRG